MEDLPDQDGWVSGKESTISAYDWEQERNRVKLCVGIQGNVTQMSNLAPPTHLLLPFPPFSSSVTHKETYDIEQQFLRHSI